MNEINNEKIWWYSNDDHQKIGPVSKTELEQLYLDEKISSVTKMWSDGLLDWRLLSEIPELAMIIVKNPPPLHSLKEKFSQTKLDVRDTQDIDNLKSDNIVTDDKDVVKNPRPWIRFFAKMFDLLIFTSICFFIIGIIEAIFAIVIIPESIINNNLTAGLLAIPLALLLDSICMAIFGNTPGKKLLKLQIKNQSGNSLNFSQALNRNFSLYVRGFGLGIPIISLFTLYHAYQILNKTGNCVWDTDQNLTVIYRKIGILRGFIFAVIFIPLYIGLSILGTMDFSQYSDEINLNGDQTSEYSEWKWINPITNETVYIDSSWSEQEKSVDSPETLLTLMHESGNSIIYLIHENFDYDVQLTAYVNAVKEMKKNTLGLVDFSIGPDNHYYSSYGKFEHEGSIFDSYIRIWNENEKSFWHIVVITDPKSGDWKEETTNLIASLIKSTEDKNNF